MKLLVYGFIGTVWIFGATENKLMFKPTPDGGNPQKNTMNRTGCHSKESTPHLWPLPVSWRNNSCYIPIYVCVYIYRKFVILIAIILTVSWQ